MSKYDEMSEVKPQSVNWGKVGDFIDGIFIGARHGIKTKFNDNNSLYDIQAEDGSFHDDEGDEVKIMKEEVWSVWGRNDIFNGQMNRLKLGQELRLKFTDNAPSSYGKGKEAKIIKIFTGGTINQEWLNSQDQDKDFNL